MLENVKKVKRIRNILMAIISIILVLGIYINVEAIDLSSGAINPIYKPEWEKVSSSINIDESNLANSTISVVLKGSANKEQEINSDVQINYSSTVTSTLAESDITVYIDGVEVESITRPTTEEGRTANKGKIFKELTTIPADTTEVDETTYTLTLSGFEQAARQGTKNFLEWSGNISIKIVGRGKEASTYSEDTLIDVYGNQNMMETDQDGTNADGTWIDVLYEDTEIDTNTNGKMFTDFIRPEFTYSYTTTNPDINTGNESVTVVFDVTDKYFESTALANDSTGSLITVVVDDDENANTPITKVLRKIQNIYYDETSGVNYVNIDPTTGEEIGTGVGTKVGERYQLVITGLDREDGFTYSGPMTLLFGAGAEDGSGNLTAGIRDKSGNLSAATAITMGVNEPGGDSDDEIIVDVVDPVWEVQNAAGENGKVDVSIDAAGNVSATMTLIGKDKYFKQSTLTADDIKIKVGTIDDITSEAPDLEKNLGTAEFIKLDGNGNYVTATEEEAIGVKYQFSVSGFKETEATFFANRALYNTNPETGRPYREYSGEMVIEIPANKLEDDTGNKNNEFDIPLDHVDTLKPEVIKVSSQANINATNVELSTHTIVFDIVDKYFDTSAITTTDTSKIHVYLDGEETTTVTKTITDIEQLNAEVDGNTRKVGYRYTLVLSNFENPRTGINYSREYTDWSGVLTIKIDANTAYDVNPNNASDRRGNAETILAGNEANTSNLDYADFVDYIKPDATYEYKETDVDYDEEDGKTFSMTFDITDKFYNAETLSVTDLQILISAEEELEEGEDGYDDLTSNSKIGKSLREEDITNTVNGASKVIGKRYTLVLTNLEQVQKIEGNYYLDYSGIITIKIPANKVTDKGPAGTGATPNGNDLTVITSGVNIPGGEVTDVEAIDVVAPKWERTEFSTDIHNKTATIKLLGTDKYFFDYDKDGDLTSTDDDVNGTLTLNEIKLFVNGTEATGNIAISTEERLYEERMVQSEYGDGDVDSGATTETVQYGVEYTITITDFTIEANQVKIQLTEGSLIDKSGNNSRATEFLVYNTLIEEDSVGGVETKKFLREIVPGGKTAIARQDIEKVVFVNNIEGSTADGVQNVWDVSAQRDNSILAWYSETSAPYTVYIGSNDDIYGNINSYGLFEYIGYGDSCTNTDVIEGLNLLHTENVTDMSAMFSDFGHKKLSSLTLPATFDTSNVTDMSMMFNECGYTAMTSLTLPEAFDTSSVTDMTDMFSECGYTAMISITLPETFDTSSVTDMHGMFSRCGYTAMTSLTLPESFDTSSVTDMSHMFNNCGYTAMTTLTLSKAFNTRRVTDMSYMFQFCGYTAMTSLDLSAGTDATNTDQFNTENVKAMSQMFRDCGNMLMTTLNLGNNFDTRNVTHMDTMFHGCGDYKLEYLDLGDKFSTISAVDMSSMFAGCGGYSMKTLDLGPMFTKIADENSRFISSSTGKFGCIIYAPESIYNDMKHFKLNSDSTTTIEYTNGKINPVYKPEWEKVSSSFDTTTGIMTVTVKGSANKTFTNGSYTGTYVSDVASILPIPTGGTPIQLTGAQADLINVYIDEELSKLDTNNDGTPDTETVIKTITSATTSTNATTGAKEVQYTITLDLDEDTMRRSGKNFLEWSGNVSVQPTKGTLRDKFGSYITTQTETDEDGNSVDVQIPITNVFTNSSGNYIGNSNRAEIDTGTTTDAGGNTVLVMEKVEIEDATKIDTTTDGKMFLDTIIPEFTYEYYNTEIEGDTDANTVIDYVNNKITVVFDVTDKYFASSTLSSDTTGNNITVKVDNDVNANTAITKALSKKTLAEDQTVGDITYKANGDIYYTVNGTSQKIGERYELVITGLESANGVGYSGPMTLSFPAGTITDKSGNTSAQTIITIGIDTPTSDVDDSKHPEHNTEVVVDVVNPIWVGLRDQNSIDRTTDTVNIKILGIDKYYKTNTLTTDKITVYLDMDGDGTAEDSEILSLNPNTQMVLEPIGTTELETLAQDTELANYDDVKVGYTLKLTGFGNYSGVTRIKIADGTIEDQSGNKNENTDTIYAGNIIWEESNEPLESGAAGYPRYPAFRNDIVDFIDPIIKYTYSTVEIDTDGDGIADSTVSANPDINYDQKKVTIKFTVIDKYLLESKLIKTDAGGNLTTLPDNMSIVVDGTTVYDSSLATQNTQVTTSITVADITDGKEYTLVVSNLQQQTTPPTNTSPENGDGISFSGPMQLIFAAGVIDDTSGNKNALTTISLDTHVDPDIVDVVDPIIKYVSSSIDRVNNTVTLMLRAEDKYYRSETLSTAENSVKVKVVDEYGNVVVNDTTTITKDITKSTTQPQYAIFNVQLSGFSIYEGKTSIIIPADVIKDSSGNGNVETEILVGNSSDSTAFKDSIVDFTKPTWEYVTSTINRVWDEDDRRLENGEQSANGTVTLEVKGTDIYFDNKYYNDEAYQLNLSNVKVYVNGVENTTITKSFATNADGSIKKEYIEETKTLATSYDRVFKGVKYTLVLGNFGTNEGTVKIEIPKEAIKDTSTNGNIATPIDVGNPAWVETDAEPDVNNPKYTAFRNDIVDFIKPKIKYQYVDGTNPSLNRTNETVDIMFTVTDTNFLESGIGIEDFKIYIDNMQVYGTGSNTLTNIQAQLLTPAEATENNDGLKYTLRLSVLELNGFIEDLNGNGTLDTGEDINSNGTLDKLTDIFERHSGVIKFVIAEDQVFDTSGNPNNETTIIVDNGDGDDEANGVIVDFVNPNIYYQDKYINWEERYALITVRATDRFYDTTTKLDPSDIKLYEKNAQGNYVEITSIPQSDITITPVANAYGYDFVIRLDNFEEEFEMRINISAGQVKDTSNNSNDATEIFVSLDNRKPVWNYVSTDTTAFEESGVISFTVKGQDKFLDLENSNLVAANVKVLKDGVDITNIDNITVTYIGTNTAAEADEELYEKYKIDVTGLTTDAATYTLVIAKDTLVDTYGNKSAATTINFSNAVISSNTANYVNVTYYVSPDLETVHKSYAHELMSVNTTGTNFESTTYRPSTLGELYNNGENPLFAEPMYEPSVNGYTIQDIYAPKSFAGWAEADEKGNVKYYTDANLTTVSTTKTSFTKVFGLYDEIPKTVVHLKAVWQDATVVFVSASAGNNSNDGKLPTTPVADLQTAYSKLNASGTAESNIIVIMDAVEFSSTDTLNGNATITSLYAGVDYEAQGAELNVSAGVMTVNGDIIFDNIELYTLNYSVLVSNYSGDITLGRNITTPEDAKTFDSIIGGNFGEETSSGELGTHTIRVESGIYAIIVAGTYTEETSEITKSVTHNVILGNMRDAAVSRNSKLHFGAMAIGFVENQCYPSGATTTQTSANKTYANVTLYSGTIGSANSTGIIYLRTIMGKSDGLMNFKMYGGELTGFICGGSRVSTMYATDNFNTMKFYGGQVIGNITGQGMDNTFTGSTTITLQGNFSMTGDVFGGTVSEEASCMGEGNTTIIVDSASTTINGNIYGGSYEQDGSTAYVTGNTNITLKAGNVSNIYGSGYNSGNTGTTNITIENGAVTGNIYGGAYQAQARGTVNITVLGGTVNGNIYGGNDNSEIFLTSDSYTQNVNITIGDTDATKKPTVKGIIYGTGKYDKVGTITINLLENEYVTSVFGGSDTNSTTTEANIYLKGMTVNEIYGGGNQAGTVTTSNIYLGSGTATTVYGGGYKADVDSSMIYLGDIDNGGGTATVTTIYGGSNASGTVGMTDITLLSGNLTEVFGGGNSASVGETLVSLCGITIDTIHGGSENGEVEGYATVYLESGTVTNVFGGGLDGGAIGTVVLQEGATVTNIYGGNEGTEAGAGGNTEMATVIVKDSEVENIYGGNYLKGTVQSTYITVHGNSTVTGDIYGGGYKSNIGTSATAGNTSINIAKGTIQGDIHGGSEQGVVYGKTNVNIGFESLDNPEGSMVDSVTSATAGNINIIGTIYGSGSTNTAGTTTVIGETHITMDNSTTSPITYLTADGKEKSIYGSGKGGAIYQPATTDKSTIHITDVGTAATPYLFKSIEDTGDLYIGNSVVEISGALDRPVNNTEIGHYYTLNTITNALTIYNNTTLYTQRGFNKVGGFFSYQNQKTTKSYATITDGEVTARNVDNRLYTLEGVNLIFAKEEVTLSNKSTLDMEDWGEVTGMTYFGTYKNTASGKQYDLDLFKAGTYVEGQYNSNHNIERDGFYTTVVDETTNTEIQQRIDTINYTNYCDWIINAPTINYDIDLVASTYGQHSIAELLLDYKYATDYAYKAETIYTLNKVSSNALKPEVQLVDPTDPTKLPTISTNANNVFGLTMETTNLGWKEQALTKIYSASNGSYDGDTEYKSDNQTTPGSIKFKLYNSINITEEKDLGLVTIILTGQQPISESGVEAYTFNVVIAVNLQTIVDELKEQYTPSFTDRPESELSYTTDSRVDMSYLLYKDMEATPYATGDYRVLSTTVQLPVGTRLTMKDYGQGDSANKVYYYHVASNTDYDSTETVNGTTRYLYKLTKFKEMGSTNSPYTDSTSYYNSTNKYALEKYDISIDFIDSGISEKLAQETYLELRSSSGTVKLDNGDKIIKYNLKAGNNAIATTTISNEGNSYSIVEDLEIPIDITASILEQNGIMDTKYYNQIAGIAIQIVGEDSMKIKTPELQNFKLTNIKTGEVYDADSNGVIRMPIFEAIGSMAGSYKLSITQANVTPGLYKGQVLLYTADDGKYYGSEAETEPLEFNITFISRLAGLLSAEAKDRNEGTRIVNKATGLSLVDGSQTSNALDFILSINNPTNETNIRVELYKRNSTYTDLADETTYTGTSYTLVDIKNYLQGTWTESVAGSKEYIVSAKKNYATEVQLEEITFQKAIIQGIDTGEYKLVFKTYSDDTLLQTFSKTFIISE